MNLDRAYKRVGEYGRVQWLLTFVNSVARNGGCYMYYPFAYLVLKQQYLCLNEDGEYAHCEATDICAAKENDASYNDYQVDTNYTYYLKNWYTEMDLVCMKPSTIGMMITAYYIGFAMGGLFFAFPDKYGRKWSCMMGLLISCVSQTAMIVSSNYWMRLFMFGVMGFS